MNANEAKERVDIALAEYELAWDAYEVFMAEWRLKVFYGIEPANRSHQLATERANREE